jgi:uncharacterized membrane protein
MRPVPAWVSPVLLGSSAVVLGMRWSSIPEKFVVHWDANGQPNGWAERSVSGVLMPIALGFGVWLVLEIIGAAVRASGTRKAVGGAVADTIRLVGMVLTGLFSVLAVSLPLGPAIPPSLIAGGMLVMMALALVVGSMRISRAVNASKANDAELEGYHGLYYSNAKDSRLWVPKLSGLGSTINFAHPWAWPVMVLLVSGPIVVVIATIVMTRCH